ncbi:Chitin binding Peritrophin-A domain containing protein [Ditylenchus destructor]|nr:Chitin binding Peritrophin-A domain containing protein [Ditylenchus destructor]
MTEADQLQLMSDQQHSQHKNSVREPAVRDFLVVRNTVEAPENSDNIAPHLQSNQLLQSSPVPHWRVVLGDLCQLPNVRRPAEDPRKFAECTPLGDTNNANRKDLGIWRMRECPPSTEFVSLAQLCMPSESVLLQQQLCDDPQLSEQFDFCPPQNSTQMWLTMRKVEHMPRPCICPKDDLNCDCEPAQVEVLEPHMFPLSKNDVALRRKHRYPITSLPDCPCPPLRTNCVCMDSQRHQPQVFMDCCCAPAQPAPCQCVPIAEGNQINPSPFPSLQPSSGQTQQFGPPPSGFSQPQQPFQPQATGPFQPQAPQTHFEGGQYQQPNYLPPSQPYPQQQVPPPSPYDTGLTSTNAQSPNQVPFSGQNFVQYGQGGPNFVSGQPPSLQPQQLPPSNYVGSPQGDFHMPGEQHMGQSYIAPPLQSPGYNQIPPQPQFPSQSAGQPSNQQGVGGYPMTQPPTYIPPPMLPESSTTPVIQSQPCPLVQSGDIEKAHYQSICSWMLDPLTNDPESRTHFLQCQPAPYNVLCGRWQRMPCAPATIFDMREQLCVWDSAGKTSTPGNIPSPGYYGPYSNINQPYGGQTSGIVPSSGMVVPGLIPQPQPQPQIQFPPQPQPQAQIQPQFPPQPNNVGGQIPPSSGTYVNPGPAQIPLPPYNPSPNMGTGYPPSAPAGPQIQPIQTQIPHIQSPSIPQQPPVGLQTGGWGPTANQGTPVSQPFAPAAPGYPSPNQPMGIPFPNTGATNLVSPATGDGPLNRIRIYECTCTGGVQIGTCGPNLQCPGQSICQVGLISPQVPCRVCCYYRK